MTRAASTWGGALCRPNSRGHVAARGVRGRERPPSAAHRLTRRPDLGGRSRPGVWPALSGPRRHSSPLASVPLMFNLNAVVLSGNAHQHAFRTGVRFPGRKQLCR
jgi:hypothetical protein